MANAAYLGHSAFLVQTDAHLLLFDYVGGFLPPIPEGGTLLTLSSHAHSDHYDLAALRAVPADGRAFGFDIPKNLPGEYLAPGEEAHVSNARVRAFGSTDEGVSFLVESGGLTVFHAGDLNFWHWRAESSPEEVREAERAFEAALSPLRGLSPDIAMFPADPRMGEGFLEGALRFCEAVKPKLFLPMHFWNMPEAAVRFARSPMPEGVRARALTVPGESVEFGKEAKP